MSIAQTIYSILSSAITGTNIYPVLLPTGATLPAITYQIIATTTNPTLTNVGMRKYRVQIDCWGSTYASTDALRSQVIQTLDGYKDNTVLSSWLAMGTDFFEQDALQLRSMTEFYILSDI